MKKEHWLYLVIAILAIWIIVLSVGKSKEDTNTTDDAVANEERDLNEIGMPVPDADGEEVVENVVEAVAGENKGTIASVGIPSSTKVVVSDQTAGTLVAIGAVDMSVNGWVVVHEDRDGAPGNILGAQRFDAGSYTGGQVELLRATVAGGKYYVMLHQDNGDKMFDHILDLPYKSSESAYVMATFIAK